MPSIEILRNTICGGKMVAAGDVVEASKEDADLLIGLEKAKPAEGGLGQRVAKTMKAAGSALVGKDSK